jgi:hypothetical protein
LLIASGFRFAPFPLFLYLALLDIDCDELPARTVNAPRNPIYSAAERD